MRAAAARVRGRPGGADRGGARLRADGDRRRRLHPAAALRAPRSPSAAAALPRPGHLGRRVRCLLGAGPLRPGAAERAGAGRAGGRGAGGPARRPGVAHGRAGAGLLRAARRPGAARGGAAQRREPAPHPRGDPAAARRRPGHGVRHRAGAGAARASRSRRFPRSRRRSRRRSTRSGCWWAGRRPRSPRSWTQAAPLPALPGARSGRQPRFADPAAARRRGGGAAGRGGAGVRRRGQGGLPAPRQPRRQRRLHRRRPSAAWATTARSATRSARSSPGRRSTSAGSRRGWTRARAREAEARGAVHADGAARAAGGGDGAGPLPDVARRGWSGSRTRPPPASARRSWPGSDSTAAWPTSSRCSTPSAPSSRRRTSWPRPHRRRHGVCGAVQGARRRPARRRHDRPR